MARQLSRRKFMVYSLAASTLTLAAPVGCDTSSAEGVEPTAAEAHGPSRVLVTGADEEMLVLEVTAANKVVLRLPRVEVGQGITTAVAMMIAEELDARLVDVDIPLAEARTKGNQYTGGSSSVRSLYGPARPRARRHRPGPAGDRGRPALAPARPEPAYPGHDGGRPRRAYGHLRIADGGRRPDPPARRVEQAQARV
ncbi:molybdopterin cofactor-binding domain-containing protein [Streptomyces mirabilis]|uniref:molybdopterin cofactor-binding domain-containing protein n=1 Tax=Streptomyces mirabilis TaxID=68239 RepID=UPI002B1CD4BD|nr:molybdopterin cofactor-binding domain-containing protein [Streptomyces mirabilis]